MREEPDPELAQAIVDFAAVLQDTFSLFTPSWRWKERKAELIRTVSLSDDVTEEQAGIAFTTASLALAGAHNRQKRKGAFTALAGLVFVIGAFVVAPTNVGLAIVIGFFGGLILLPAGGRYWAKHVGHSRKWKKIARLEV